MKSNHLLLCMVFLGTTLFTRAQLGTDGPYGKDPNKFIPSTPEAASFQRYGDVPVSYENGLVNISIPLGSISMKNFTWPISLSCHAGGNKVGDIANSTGLGWTLNAFGLESGKVIGKKGYNDPEWRLLNLTNTYGDKSYNECDFPSEADVLLAENIVGGGTEYLPDLGYVNTPLFNLKSIEGIYFPATDIRTCTGYVPKLGGYDTLGGYQDTKGNKFLFKDLGFYNSTNSSTCYQPGVTENTVKVLFCIQTYGKDTLYFSYDTATYSYDMIPTKTKSFVMASQCAKCNLEIGGDNTTCSNTYNANDPMIKKIESTTGEVIKFYYSSRSDVTSAKMLDSVEFKRKVAGVEELLNKYILVDGYFGSGSGNDLRLKLSELKLYDKTSTLVNKHVFEYNSTSLPNRVTSKAIDWFGYYNGQTGNTSLLPDEGIRTSSTTYAKACVLEKITYPTGGATLFEYERNPFGGLRVKSVKDYDSISMNPKVRSFNYHTAEGDGGNNGMGFEDYLVSNYFATNFTTGAFDVEDEENIYVLNCYTQRIHSNPITNMLQNYIENDNHYSHITEYFGSDSANGKIEYFFDNVVKATGPTYSPPEIQLTGKKVYKQKGGSYDLLSESINVYDDIFSYSADPYGGPLVATEQRILVKDITQTRGRMSHTMQGWMIYWWCETYLDNSFALASMPVLLTKTIEKNYMYGPDLVMTDTVKYFYDSLSILQPTRIVRMTSEGDTITLTNTYPVFAIPAGVSLSQGEEDALDSMINSNIRTSPYYSTVKNNSSVISKELLLYQMTQGMALPKKQIEYPTGSSSSNEYFFNSYDGKANLLEFQGKDKVYHSMIYDSSSNLLARCVGAVSTDIAYSSFETGHGGNWSGISYGNIVKSTGITGGAYYQASFSFSKTGLNSSGKYTVSYWSQNGSYTVNSGSGTAIINLDGWTYYEHEISSPGSGTITITGNGKIDELRLYPKSAQMTTFTHDPHIGVSSVSDAAGRILYYEYDNAGRLLFIKDQDKNILKAHQYKYH